MIFLGYRRTRLCVVQTNVHHAIETFIGQMLRAELVLELINHPANAINIESNAHDPMVLKLAWGIEAIFANHKVRSRAILSLL